MRCRGQSGFGNLVRHHPRRRRPPPSSSSFNRFFCSFDTIRSSTNPSILSYKVPALDSSGQKHTSISHTLDLRLGSYRTPRTALTQSNRPTCSETLYNMDFCFFIPVIFGCPTKIKQEGDGSARVCPRCNNAQVVQAKARTWFELCWIPLIPMKSKHIYICNICQWQSPQDGGFQPQIAGGGFGGHQGYPQPQQYGYGPPPQGQYGYPPPKQ